MDCLKEELFVLFDSEQLVELFEDFDHYSVHFVGVECFQEAANRQEEGSELVDELFVDLVFQ